ncbi:hypothetical protein IQ238_28865 [Pleurocapsales cyanobacterium LEGE 06147]|nr:hypothetical protein [Pleurocapsales cyanobacterium LEGE 06147]
MTRTLYFRLVVDTIPPHSIPELAYVQIVGNLDSSFQVKRNDLMLLKPSTLEC